MTKDFGIKWTRGGRSRILGVDSLAAVAPLLADEPEIFVVYDRNVAWVAEAVMKGMPAGHDGEEPRAKAIAIDTSEGLKTLETVLALERQLLAAGASRGALLLAVGGGITTDIVGFAASIYKRGIRYANLPTTLLAQVDAAIGGKTGVNLDGYKNELGAFHMPAFTFLCPEPLQTLPEREMRCGLAEMLKTFLIADADAYRQAIDLLPCTEWHGSVHDPAQTGIPCTQTPGSVHGKGAWAQLALRAAEIKAAIVEEDPFEHGVRMKLNLGHTFAHALEALQARHNPVKHGEAVAIGTILAAQLSESLGLAENGLAARLEQDFRAVGLPVESPVPPAQLVDAMRKDKKAAGGKVRFVLPVRPGEVIVKELELNDLYFHTA